MAGRASLLLTLITVLTAATAAQAREPFAYHMGGRMGFYYQSSILEKTALDRKGAYAVHVRRVDNTGGVETQVSTVDCNPAKPSVSGDWGSYEGKVFNKDFEISGATEAVYNLLWAVCRGEAFKSLDGVYVYEGDSEMPVAEGSIAGKPYRVHILSRMPVEGFRALREVALEFRDGKNSVKKTAHVLCDHDVPTVTIDQKTHELAGLLFVGNADDARKLNPWGRVWIATCLGSSRFERGR